MTSLSVTTWRLLVDGAAREIEQALIAELGPSRATTAALVTGPGQIAICIDSPSTDRWGTVWVAVVELSPFWARDVFAGEPVDLTIDVNNLTVTTSNEQMDQVAAGGDFDTWRGGVICEPFLRSVDGAGRG
jgi:hypothetical protein